MALIRSEEWPNAADEFRKCVEDQPEFAEFQFRYAQCLSSIGDWNRAQKHFAIARDLDGYPTRMNADYRAVVEKLTTEFKRPLIDSAAVLRPHTAHGILDRTIFHDNVHPTMKTFYLLGIEAAKQIAAKDLLPSPGDPASANTPSLSTAVQELGVDKEHLALAYQRTAYGLKELSALRFEQFDRLEQSRKFLTWAERLRSGNLKPGNEGTEPLE